MHLASAIEDAFFTRQEPFHGWEVTDSAGDPFRTDPGDAGLVIREQPSPELGYWNNVPAATPESHPDYIPFAYGKSRRASIWPFWNMNAMAVGHNNYQMNLERKYRTSNITMADTWIHHNDRFYAASYQDGGLINFRSATDPGSDHSELSGLKIIPIAIICHRTSLALKMAMSQT